MTRDDIRRSMRLAPTLQQGIPRNLVTKKPYRGVNVFRTASPGFASPYWLTLKQANERDGSICKGEKGTPVIFRQWLESAADDDEQDTKRIPLLRYYTVFNLEQTSGIETPMEPHQQAFQPIERCETLVASMPQRPTLHHGEPRAYYRPFTDAINMPQPERFDSPEESYSPLFHEIPHSTGQARRLNRPTLTDLCPFGSTNYSKEELVAEMGAAFLCGVCGVENRTVDNAAAQAQRAADFIQGVTYQD